MQPYSLRVSFLVVARVAYVKRCHGLRALNVTNKTNKQPFIERCMWPLFQWKITWQSKWGNKCRTTLGFKFKTRSKLNPTLKVEMFKLLFPLSFPWTGKKPKDSRLMFLSFPPPPFKVESLQGWLVFKEAFQPYLLRMCLFWSPYWELLFFKGLLWGWQAPWKNWASFEEGGCM